MADMERLAYGNYKGESFTIWQFPYAYRDVKGIDYMIDIYPETMANVGEAEIDALENKYSDRLDFYSETFGSLDACYRFLMNRNAI